MARVCMNHHIVTFTTEEERIKKEMQPDRGAILILNCAAICNVMQFAQTLYYV